MNLFREPHARSACSGGCPPVRAQAMVADRCQGFAAAESSGKRARVHSGTLFPELFLAVYATSRATRAEALPSSLRLRRSPPHLRLRSNIPAHTPQAPVHPPP